MTYVSATPDRDTEAAVDFMSRGYHLIGEPLNLLEPGQQWFTRIYNHEVGDRAPAAANGARGLVLGATTWLAVLLSRRCAHVAMADNSRVMLELARKQMRQHTVSSACVEYCHANWLDLPEKIGPVDAIVGDNSFSFLPFPDGWADLCSRLATAMATGGQLMARVLTAPWDHRSLGAEQILGAYAAQATLNCTELRASLLFSHWNPSTYGIETERVVSDFDRHRPRFDALIEKFGVGAENDLVTIEKYRGADAVYYAPPLDRILAVFGQYFKVTAVQFGPYRLSQYFPLIVAHKV